MGCSMVHFGNDESFRLPILSNAGFSVLVCGTSVTALHDAVFGMDIDADLFSEGGAPFDAYVPSLARKLNPAPLIVFQGAHERCNPSEFDLVIPSFSHSRDWLASISDLLKHSSSIQEHSKALRIQSSLLREDSARVRAKSRQERERLRQLKLPDHREE